MTSRCRTVRGCPQIVARECWWTAGAGVVGVRSPSRYGDAYDARGKGAAWDGPGPVTRRAVLGIEHLLRLTIAQREPDDIARLVAALGAMADKPAEGEERGAVHRSMRHAQHIAIVAQELKARALRPPEK